MGLFRHPTRKSQASTKNHAKDRQKTAEDRTDFGAINAFQTEINYEIPCDAHQRLPPVSLQLSISLGRATRRFRYPLLIIPGDHCIGAKIFDCPANRFVYNRHIGTNSNPVEYLDHVRRTHSDASVACFPAQKRFLRRSMDINAPLKRPFVLRFGSAKPDYSACDRVTSRRVCRQYFASRLSSVKNRAGGRSCTNFCCDLQTTERSLPTSKIISFSVAGSRNLVATIDFTV